MRNLNQVIAAILKQIPEDFKHRESMERRFGFVLESIPYTAPEALYIRWEQCAEILSDYIPEPTTDWQKTALNIWAMKVDYQDYL